MYIKIYVVTIIGLKRSNLTGSGSSWLVDWPLSTLSLQGFFFFFGRIILARLAIDTWSTAMASYFGEYVPPRGHPSQKLVRHNKHSYFFIPVLLLKRKTIPCTQCVVARLCLVGGTCIYIIMRSKIFWSI